MSDDWREQAVCRSVDPEMMFPNTPTEYVRARNLCRSCPVQAECLEDALVFARARSRGREAVFGVWAGLSGAELSALAAEVPGGVRVTRAWR